MDYEYNRNVEFGQYAAKILDWFINGKMESENRSAGQAELRKAP